MRGAEGRNRALVAALAAALLLPGCAVVGAPGSSTGAPRGEPIPTTAVDPGEAGGGAGRGDDAPRPVAGPVPRPFQEVRALWVVRTTLTSPERIRAMVEAADRGGFNTLLVQVRGRGDAYYRSAWEPRAEALAGQPPDFDPLDLVLREAHARGIAVHAWVNTYLVAGVGPLPADPDHVVNRAPDLLAVPRELAGELRGRNPFGPGYVEALLAHARANGDQVEGLYTSPSSPDVQEGVVRVWTDLLRSYPLDGVHMDYVRYPGPAYDHSARTLEAFRRWAAPRVPPARAAQLDAALRGDALAWTRGEPGLWGDFRREQVTSLVRRVHREAKALRPGVLVSAAVFADAEDARAARFQDWPGWLRQGILDVAVPMAYTPDDARFRGHIADAVAAAGGDPRRVWAGIGVYRTTFDGTVSKIDIAREVGATGVVLFSYDWAASQGEARGGTPFLERVGRRSFAR